jgi:hypothetical protein
MESGFIRVTQRGNPFWTVMRGPRSVALLTFKVKSHAVAYARAMSYSGKLTLYVDDEYGIAIKQHASSLSYPVVLH